MNRKQKRSIVIFGGLALIGGAAALTLTALSEQVTFFRTPTDVFASTDRLDDRFRLGGLVVEGSVENLENTTVHFKVEDTSHAIPVIYAGILPDLFREGQGIIAEGKLDNGGTFVADTVLAKHDENYMPKEVADSLKEQGYWKDEQAEATQ